MGLKHYFLLLLLFISGQCFSVGFAQDNPEENAADRQQAFLLYKKALQAFQGDDFHGCIEFCRQAISYDHGDKQLFHLEALAYADSGETEHARQAFEQALILDYNFIQCRNNLGLFQMKLGKFDEAKMTFQECIRIKPKYPDAHYHLGVILQKKGDLDAAIEEYETATRLNPNYFEAQRDLGLAIYERSSAGLSDIADSEEKLKIAERLAPTNPMIHYHLGNIYCADGKLDEAEAEFRLALTNDSRLAGAHYELGRLRYLRGDPDRCLVELNLASKVSPTYTEDKKYPEVDISQLKSMMAKCYEIKNDVKQAISFWEDVASMSKDNKNILKHANKLEKEKTAISRRREKGNCVSAQSILIKGVTETDAGELDAAKATFETMTTDYPDCFEGWQNHGAIQDASSNLQAAMADYKKALWLSA